MKIRFFLLLIMGFSTAGLTAQIANGINEFKNYGFIFIPKSDSSVDDIEGSPYFDENYTRGIVLIEDEKPLEAYLRYNVAEERIEIKAHFESPEVYQLPWSSGAKYKINSQDFVLEKLVSEGDQVFGYFVELYNGENFRLLKKPYAKYTQGKKAKTSYESDKPGKITLHEKYYIISDSGETINVRPRSRDLRKAYSSEKARDYLKSNKIRSEADLVSFVSYLDQN